MSLRTRIFVVALGALVPPLGLSLYTLSIAWSRIGGAARLGVLVGSGLVAGLAFGLAWFAGEVFVRRDLRALVATARGWVTGTPSARHALGERQDDVGQLARAVDELGQAVVSMRETVDRAEAGRRTAEGRVMAALSSATDAAVGVNDAGQITLFNKGAERIFGYAAREAIGQPAELLLPSLAPGERRQRIRDLAAALDRREVIGKRKDGNQFPAEIGVATWTHLGQAAYLIVVRDIAEGKHAEEALRESEARFRGAFEHSAAGMALQSVGGSFLRVNRALCEMLGYSDQDLLGMTHQQLCHPEDPEPDSWYERELLAESIRWYKREQRYVHKQGHVVWGLLSVSLVRGGDAGASYFLVQVYDITERKRAEALEAQLRQAQKIEAVGQLAAGVAHDFNNLLMVITGRSHILLHRLRPDDPLRRHVELIQTTAQRAGALTQQLLAFSRRQVLEPRVLDLNVIVTGMVPMLRRLIGEQIDLITMLADNPGRVKADPAQLEQVIMNLAVNARDAMPSGGRLSIETADVELGEAFARQPGAKAGAHVALTVRDTGVGMDAATQARLFEPFFTTKGPGKGTGLGLATVYGIIKQSGGYIAVDSQPGKGATFTVYLPRAQGAMERIEVAGVLVEGPGGNETILLVEDEEAVRDLAREILHQAGYTVLGARHGGDALVIGDQHTGPIHLLVTDVVMPELSGRQLADRLARRRPEMRVVFMSGYTDETIAPHGVLGKSTVLLRKPLPPETLLRKVREALDAHPAWSRAT